MPAQGAMQTARRGAANSLPSDHFATTWAGLCRWYPLAPGWLMVCGGGNMGLGGIKGQRNLGLRPQLQLGGADRRR